MTPPPYDHGHQGIDYGEKANVQNLHGGIAREQSDSHVTIKPFSLWVLVVCGIITFFAGFFSSRYDINFPGASAGPANPPFQLSMQTARADASPASTGASATAEAGSPAVVHVV